MELNKALISYDELKKYDIEVQKELMNYWIDNYKVKDVKEALGVHNVGYYKIVDTLGLKKKKRKPITNNIPNIKTGIILEEKIMNLNELEELELDEKSSTTKSIENIFEDTDRFYFSINQTGDSNMMKKKLQMIMNLIENEDEGEYNLYLTLKQSI